MFIAGSTPDELFPESDLDIFIVMKHGHEDRFFDNLTYIMDKFLYGDKTVKYSLFRGPLKYKNKGLIHFIVYTEEPLKKGYTTDAFKHELRHVLESLNKTAKIIQGKSIKELIKDVNLKDKKTADSHLDRIRKKYSTFRNKNFIRYRQWKKTPKGWRFVPTWRYCSKYFRTYMNHYFKKNLERK
jgi:hypothetical protein